MEENGRIIYVSYSRRRTYDASEGGRQIGAFPDYKALRTFILEQVAESPGLKLFTRRGINRKTANLIQRLVS